MWHAGHQTQIVPDALVGLELSDHALEFRHLLDGELAARLEGRAPLLHRGNLGALLLRAPDLLPGQWTWIPKAWIGAQLALAPG